jgi:hypothetical protein
MQEEWSTDTHKPAEDPGFSHIWTQKKPSHIELTPAVTSPIPCSQRHRHFVATFDPTEKRVLRVTSVEVSCWGVETVLQLQVEIVLFTDVGLGTCW